jgi:acyl carrier protein
MGLDSVELIVLIEKTFDIKIPDNVAEKTDTVGKLHDVVWERIDKTGAEKCATQKIFYVLRNYFNETEQMNKISPSSSLEKIISIKARRSTWNDAQDKTNYKFPKLILSHQAGSVLASVGILILLSGVYCSWKVGNEYGIGNWIYLPGSIASSLVIWGVSELFNPYRISFPVVTMKELVYKVAELNFSKLSENAFSRSEVEVIINNIISDKIGVSLEEITPEKSFVYDLGVD